MSSQPMNIAATGMCCALGYSAPSAIAAIRAGMDHFRETDFIDNTGKALLGSQLYQVNIWGSERLIWMFEHAVKECLTSSKELRFQTSHLILVLPESNRPGATPTAIKALCEHALTYPFAKTHLFYGKAGIGPALMAARMQLYKGNCHNVLIVGVDSYFTPQTITHYLEAGRLMAQDNTDGFIPGEGCGAVLLQKATKGCKSTWIIGIGVETEPATILQTQNKMMARGLSAAIRQASADSGLHLSDSVFHMSDISGESFYFREAALAITRCMDRKIPDYPHLLLASTLGETGAACGPLMLAFLSNRMADDSGPGQCGLLHFSADEGLRVAIMIKQGA